MESESKDVETQEDKYKYDLANAVGVGGVVGGVVGLFGGAAGVLAGLVGGVAGGIVGGIAGSDEDLIKPRHLIIGGLAGLAMYGAITLGAQLGYNAAKDEALIPFQTETDRGVIVERHNGTQSPYIIDASGDYVHMKDLSSLTQSNSSELESLKSEYEKRESQIYESVKEK